jgi:class 3 adenylate cyclase
MPEHPNMLVSILDLQKTGQLAELIRKLKRLLRRNLNAVERAEAQRYLGVALTDKGDYAGGLRYLQQAQTGFQSSNQQAQAAICLAEQALNYHRRGGDQNQAQALELLQTAGDLLKQIETGDPQVSQSALAKIAFYFAVVSSYTGEWEAAYHFYQEAYDLYQDSPSELAKVEDSLGKYYATLGRPTLARLYYEKSLARKTEVGDQFGLCITLSNLGLLHIERGAYQEARDHFRRALEIGYTIANHHGIAIQLNELGRVYLHLGELDHAVESLTSCLAHCGRKYPKTRALAYRNLAQTCLLQGKLQEGLTHTKQALRLFQRLEYIEGTGIARRMEGRLFEALQDSSRALKALQTAIALFRQVQKPHEVALSLLDLARIQQALGQQAEAFDGLKQALLIAEGVHDDLLVQRVQDELHQINPMEALKIAIQRQVGKETAILTASLRGHQELITVLFADIIDFTRFSAATTPLDVVDTLNDYFWDMTHVVMERNGYVDKFIGDGLMVIFRGETKGYHPYRAVLTGLKMLERLAELNRERRRLGLWEIQVRIGIHTGEAIIGNIGSYEKMDYTAIGSTVNLAQRLEAYARPNTVLISKATYQYVSGHVICYHRQPFLPKGFAEEVECWEVRDTRELVRFTPVFVEDVEAVASQPGVIAVKVGAAAPGIIAPAQGTATDECAASLIYRHPHLVLDHIGLADIKPVKILMRCQLDFDTVLAAYFAQHLIEQGVLPVGAKELSEYAKLVETARLPQTDRLWDTPYGVLQGIFEKDRRYCAQHGLSQERSRQYCLQRGFYLMEYLCQRVAAEVSLFDPALFQEEYPFEQERRLMKQ